MKYAIGMAAALALAIPGVVAADDGEATITRACEEALALSALPARLRDGASVYVWSGDGFTLSRKGDGNFHCIVERNHEKSLIPQCADAAGADTVVRGIMRKTEWAMAGVPRDERKARFAALVEQGALTAPARPGINYMMSAFNLNWNTQRNSMTRIPPHVMFYAPNLSNDDIGGSMAEGMRTNRGVPFIIEEGIHGYMTSFVERASDSSEVLEACAGQHPAFDAPVAGEGA